MTTRFGSWKERLKAGQHPHHLDLLLILALGACAYYYLALFAFHPLDPSAISVQLPKPIVVNAAGSFGALLSALAIYYFGLASFVLPLPLLGYLLRRFTCETPPSLRSFSVGAILLLLATCLAFAKWQAIVLLSEIPFAGGGQFGRQALQHSQALLGQPGQNLVTVMLGLASISLMLQVGLVYPNLRRFCRVCIRHPLYLSHTLFRKHLGRVPRPWPSLGFLTTAFNFKKKGAKQGCFDAGCDTNAAINAAINATMNATLHSAVHSQLQEEPLLGLSFPALLDSQAIDAGESSALPEGESMQTLFRASTSALSTAEQEEDALRMQRDLLEALADFKIAGTIVDYQMGPLVTTYAFKPEKGVKQASIVSLINDLALALRVDSLFVHPIPEKSALGFQIPNQHRETVRFADFVHHAPFRNDSSALPVALGKNIYGGLVWDDLSEMPHLLIAGSTGSGKSVGIHSFICNLLLKTPALRLLLIDPKMLELTYYEGLPQLLRPVITDPDEAIGALAGALSEMERRYRIMQHAKVRHISDFNAFWAKASPSQKASLEHNTGIDGITSMPFHVIVIDELADLMMTAPKDLEMMIARLAQKARASGIHMILATQRPSVDVLTGTIKANLPSRLSYRLVSGHDSRTIIDQLGAEKLLGRGDLLFQKPGGSRLARLHGAYITDLEIKDLVQYIRRQSP